jgi:hypothetical protein
MMGSNAPISGRRLPPRDLREREAKNTECNENTECQKSVGADAHKSCGGAGSHLVDKRKGEVHGSGSVPVAIGGDASKRLCFPQRCLSVTGDSFLKIGIFLIKKICYFRKQREVC